MGRTVPAITLEFMRQQKAYEGFRRGLKCSDQLALGELLSAQRSTQQRPLMQRMLCHLRFFYFQYYWKNTKM